MFLQREARAPSSSCRGPFLFCPFSRPFLVRRSVAQRRFSKDGHKKRSLRNGHQLQHMTVRVPEIDPAAAVPVVELTVVEAPGGAAVRNPRLLDALQDRVEL